MTAVRTLLAAGADQSAVDLPDQATPLHMACHESRPEVVRELLRVGNDVMDAVDKSGATALMRAAAVGDLEIVKDLLDRTNDTSRPFLLLVHHSLTSSHF